ncbi:uncharacterized protein LTR77_001925 [Saxophila tyrrhenica]|uniref:Uncharacterized protein n=1 Tax=Saxophila tyrrhenica TaxID=1690608 RepID=A0AAV9PI27_9PEZI|nr:hypothetical protein LTR77_001925 [Saxophila tyrrhenica]
MADVQLGLSAGNLEDTRLGAERVVWSIEQLLRREQGAEERRDLKQEGDGDDGEGYDEYAGRYAVGVGSKYD